MIEMAKVEAVMLFVLGFLAAALLVATILPAFNRRAQRLIQRRLEAQLPLTRQEIFAERDHLRAEFAVTVRRLERETDKQRALYAASQDALNERNKVVVSLEDELAERSRELEATHALLVEARNTDASAEIYQKQATITELERVLRDTRATVTQRDGEIAALDTKNQELMLELDRRRITVVELETRNHASAARQLDAERNAISARSELEIAQKRAETAEKKLQAERERATGLSRNLTEITLRQDNQSSLVEMLETNEIEFASKLTEATVNAARLRATIDERDAALSEAQARIKELEAALAAAPASAAETTGPGRARKGRTANGAKTLNGHDSDTVAAEATEFRQRIKEIGDAFLAQEEPKPKPAPRSKRQPSPRPVTQ